MSIKNVINLCFVTNESNRDAAKKFCKDHDLFKDNGWDIGCLYGIDKSLQSYSFYKNMFTQSDHKIISFEEFRNKFLGDSVEFNNNNNYEIY